MSWPKVAIGDVVRIARIGVAPEDIRPGTRYVGLEHIDSSGSFVGIAAVDAGELASSKFEFTRKHVLFGKLRPYLKKTARPDFEGICSTDILPLEPSRHLDREYLFHVLRRQDFVDEVSSLCAGANLPRISPSVLVEMEIPLPPLEEQRRIAAILDKADALRAKRREAIAKLNQLLESVFVEMFGGPVDNPKGWRLVRVGDVVSEFIGGKNVECPDESSSPFRILKVSAVTSKVYKSEESKPAPEFFSPSSDAIVRAGDLLFSRANTTDLVAATAYVWNTPENMVLPDKLWKLRIANDALLNPLFLWGLFKNPAFRGDLSKRSSGTSGSMKNISKSKLELMPMPLPPIVDQERFAAVSRRIHQQLASLQKAASGADDLFSSLQKSAFSGN